MLRYILKKQELHPDEGGVQLSLRRSKLIRSLFYPEAPLPIWGKGWG